jgi:hypothetical protein
MSISHLLPILLLSPAFLFAQLTNNTVTATATQYSPTQPDEALIQIGVTAPANVTLDQIVSALSSVGVTPANLTGLSGPSPMQWNFQLTVPITKLTSTNAALASLGKSISQNNLISLSFSLSGTGSSGQQTPNCNFANLISQAGTQAQQIASAAGFNTGAITGLNTGGAPCSVTVTFALQVLFAQPGPHTITVTSSVANSAQPDTMSIGLDVTSPNTDGLDDITAALAGAGISGTMFTGVDTTTIYSTKPEGTPQPGLVWYVTLTAPLSKASATIAQIAAAQLPMGLTLNFNGASVFSSQAQQPSSCPQSALVSAAQAQAQQLATAAGVSVGPILNISQGAGGGIVEAQIGLVSFLQSVPSPTCSLTVQFQLM